jgi:hypothetical protein
LKVAAVGLARPESLINVAKFGFECLSLAAQLGLEDYLLSVQLSLE